MAETIPVIKSESRELIGSDWMKIIKAVLYNVTSLIIAMSLFLMTFPTEQLPGWSWLLGLVASAPLINGAAFAFITWLTDNTRR